MQGSRESEPFNKHEGRQEGAKKGAEYVCDVQIAERSFFVRVRCLPNRSHKEGKGRSHTRTPGKHRRSDPEPHQQVIARGLPRSKCSQVVQEFASKSELIG